MAAKITPRTPFAGFNCINCELSAPLENGGLAVHIDNIMSPDIFCAEFWRMDAIAWIYIAIRSNADIALADATGQFLVEPSRAREPE